MFTGIIEKKGKVVSLAVRRGGMRLTLQAPSGWDRLPLGTSVAVDGACLTVSARARGTLSFDLLRETLRRTRFGSLKEGDIVNLERAMKAGKRFEGHFVQGHVDGTGRVKEVRVSKAEATLTVSFPKALAAYLIPKGSVALNGVSLTLGKVARGSFQAHLIPFTLRHTGLGVLKKGDRVHLEADALLKFFRRLTRTSGHYKLMPSTLAARKWNESI
jgi:riboflavin synthase alpha subunit